MRKNACPLVALMIMTCATARLPALGAPEYWPAERWRTASPESQGMSSAEIAKIFDFISERQINIHSVLLIRNGYLILAA